jgi:hypothetical protein
MHTTWTIENGWIWATRLDGRRILTWTAAPTLACLVNLLNVNSGLSALLLSAWLNPSAQFD